MSASEFASKRDGWTVKIGTIEEMNLERTEYWKSLTPQQRLDKMFELLDVWKGENARRLERTYRIVDCS